MESGLADKPKQIASEEDEDLDDGKTPAQRRHEEMRKKRVSRSTPYYSPLGELSRTLESSLCDVCSKNCQVNK